MGAGTFRVGWCETVTLHNANGQTKWQRATIFGPRNARDRKPRRSVFLYTEVRGARRGRDARNYEYSARAARRGSAGSRLGLVSELSAERESGGLRPAD